MTNKFNRAPEYSTQDDAQGASKSNIFTKATIKMRSARPFGEVRGGRRKRKRRNDPRQKKESQHVRSTKKIYSLRLMTPFELQQTKFDLKSGA